MSGDPKVLRAGADESIQFSSVPPSRPIAAFREHAAGYLDCRSAPTGPAPERVDAPDRAR